MQKNFFLIYSSSSKEDDIFFYKYGEIEKDSISELKTLFHEFKNLKIIISDISIDKYKLEIKKLNISSKYEIENNYFTYSFFKIFFEDVDLENFNKYNFSSFNVSKNILILEKYISIITENSNTFWKNNHEEKNSNLENYKIVEDKLLFDFVNEEYSKKCYGLQIPFESHSEKNTFTSFLKSNSLEPKYIEKPYTTEYTFCVEKNYDAGSNSYYNYPIKISLYNFTDIPYHDNKKYITLIEEELYFFGDYDYSENKKGFYFLIEKTQFEKYSKIKKYISDSFCINWIDENHFYKKFKKIKFKQTQIGEKYHYSIWSCYYLYGLVLKYKEFYHRYSDFGTDNDILVVHGDSNYLDLVNKKPVYVECNPAGHRSNSNGDIDSSGKYQGLEENIFKYFFDNKLYLITNVDEIHYEEHSYSNYGLQRSKKLIISKKVIKIPENLLNNTFVLTKDYFPY